MAISVPIGSLSGFQELPDAPLFYDYAELMRLGKCSVPKAVAFRSALLNAGANASGSHADPRAVKTDAHGQLLWDIVRTVVSTQLNSLGVLKL